jgi:hypothetical protein
VQEDGLGVGVPQSHGSRFIGSPVGSEAEFGYNHRLAGGQKRLEHVGVAVVYAFVPIMVVADGVEEAPFDRSLFAQGKTKKAGYFARLLGNATRVAFASLFSPGPVPVSWLIFWLPEGPGIR